MGMKKNNVPCPVSRDTIELINDACGEVTEQNLLLAKSEVARIYETCTCGSLLGMEKIDRQMFVNCYSSLASVANPEGDSPLHLACKNYCHSETSSQCFNNDKLTLELMISWSSPQVFKIQNIFGQTPLHMACVKRLPDSIIQRMVLACPDALKIVDKEGCNPLHVACNHPELFSRRQQLDSLAKEPSNTAVRLMIKACPSALRQPCHDGHNLPLHFACRNEHAPATMIQELIQAYPESLKMSTKYRGTALHLACGMHDDVELCLEMASEWPVACLVMDARKQLPYDYFALRHSHSKEHVRDMMSLTRDAACALIELVMCHQPQSSSLLLSVEKALQKIPVYRSCISKAEGNSENRSNNISYLFLNEYLRCYMDTEWLHTLLDDDGIQAIFMNSAANNQEDLVPNRTEQHGDGDASKIGHMSMSQAFQRNIYGLVQMHNAGRQYIYEDSGNKAKGMVVLQSVWDNLDCFFLHLRESPILIRESSKEIVWHYSEGTF